MQLIKPHLPSFEGRDGGRVGSEGEGGSRVFGLADVVEFRFLVGQWCLGRRAIREVSTRPRSLEGEKRRRKS